MRRTEVLCAALWAGVAAAQGLAPLPANAPGGLRAPLKVHVVAHESLEPDRLRAFGRPGVTLWLETSSNTLKASTVEHLARFDEAWVALRSPLKVADAAVLARLPRVGLWSVGRPLSDDDARRVPGVRRLAVEVVGPLDEALAEALSRRRPAQVLWRPQGSPDLLAWGLFKQLPGKKIYALPADGGGCSAEPGAPAVEVSLASLLSGAQQLSRCGRGARVVLTAAAAGWMVDALAAQDPSVELVLRPGADDGEARATARFLDALGLGPSR